MASANSPKEINNQIMAKSGGNEYTSYLPMEIAPGTPPTMRQWSRTQYISEYVDFYTLGIKSKVKGIALLALGVVTIPYFAPGALLMFALAARNQDVGWMCTYINESFGKNRSIVLVD